jgi:hypothetical protein
LTVLVAWKPVKALRLILIATTIAATVSTGAGVSAAAKSAPSRPKPTTGFDVSYPQCGQRLPGGGGFAIVGVNDGLPWSANPCLGSQWKWASQKPSPPAFYLNTANPGPVSKHWNQGGPKSCVNPSSYSDKGCAYDYGWSAAAQSLSTAGAATSGSTSTSRAWWLDVETMNSWDGSTAANAADLQGAYDYLKSRGVAQVGVYSTGYQWGVITGGYTLTGAPDWVAGASSQGSAASYCHSSFSGGPVRLVQYPAGNFDGDWACA